MTDNVVPLKAPRFGQIPVDEVLEMAKGKLETVLVIGIEAGGADEPKRYYASSDQMTLAGVIYEMELFKHKILAGDFG